MNEAIFKDVSELGYSGLELFDWQINGLESQGVLAGFVQQYKLPLISSYTSINLTDPAQRAGTIAAAVAVGKILKKYGGKTIVIWPSGVSGQSYNYADHKQNIVTTLNEPQGHHDCLIAALHQHTGTAKKRAMKPTPRWPSTRVT
jgi:inosose dehydratase